MRVSTGVVKLRRANGQLMFTVPEVIPAEHLVGKTFRTALITGVDRDVITFTHVRPPLTGDKKPEKFDPRKDTVFEIASEGRREWKSSPKTGKQSKGEDGFSLLAGAIMGQAKEGDKDDISYGHIPGIIRHGEEAWDSLTQTQKAERTYDMARELEGNGKPRRPGKS